MIMVSFFYLFFENDPGSSIHRRIDEGSGLQIAIAPAEEEDEEVENLMNKIEMIRWFCFLLVLNPSRNVL